MQLLVVRHAIAEDGVGKPDEARELTGEGREKMERGAKALRAMVPEVQIILASPLVRACQTAAIIEKEYKNIPIQVLEDLTPESSPDETIRAIANEASRYEVVCCVGHEPNLSGLVSLALSGSNRSFIQMKKGGASFLTFSGAPRIGAGVLRWHLAPSLLRELKNFS